MTKRAHFVRGQQPDGKLKLSHDRKVSPRGWYQQSRNRWVPKIPNSFGLPAGKTCPGRTPFCDLCYAKNSEQGAGVSALVEHNYKLLCEAGTVVGMTQLLTEMIWTYVREADRRELEPHERIFRIHWDGDFFSEDYALAWAITMIEFPEIKFWVYTRSFASPVNVVPILAYVDNLKLYLSTDEWNLPVAEVMAKEFDNVHLAFCSDDHASAMAMAPERKARICPENAGKVALMTDGTGACVTCGLCPEGRADVTFATSGKRWQPVQLRLDLPGIAAGFKAGTCMNPGCHNLIVHVGRGRPAKYCSEVCRWKSSRLMQKQRAPNAN